jgi:methylase of polypeptide subunit release factors
VGIMGKLIERELQGKFLTAFETIFSDEKYRNYDAIQEEGRADITIKESGKPLFFIELKDPLAKDGRSVGNSDVFQREFHRAKRLKINHFGISNFTEAVIHSLTEDVGEDRRENYESRGFPTLKDINRFRDSGNFSKILQNRFKALAEWYLQKAETILKKGEIEKQPLDDIFIRKLQKSIENMAVQLSEIIYEQYSIDGELKREVNRYFSEQGWSVPTEESDFDNFSHISVLMFISKIVFYNAVRDSKNYELNQMKISDSESIEDQFWSFMNHLKLKTDDFELLIGQQNSIESRAIFLDESIARTVIDEVVENSEKYNFSKMEADIIGRIFEELIKPDERHKMGQYFTSSNVVDLINSFAIRRGDEKVLDPSCGSGAFLTGLYKRKKSLGEREHSQLLNQIHGVDISSYPAFLSMLNLSIRDLSQKSYPRIVQKDLFRVAVTNEKKAISLEKVHDSDGKEIDVEFSQFDAIVGNPPYTRQEDIDSYNPNQKSIIENTLNFDIGKEFVKDIPKRTSLYGYFFYRAEKLLKDNGYLGYITSNSWLDVDFGAKMQSFMVERFRVVAIIDSKVERFFDSADVNTNITILQKGTSRRNRTKFVYLKKRLSEVIEDFGTVDRLRDFIEETEKIYEDEFLRINPVLQCRLRTETKWSKFLKAPKIYWDIIEKGKGKWQRLGDIADVRFGIKTGVNEFFYLQEKKGEKTPRGTKLLKNGVGEEWIIEDQFLKPVIKSPREIKGYTVAKEELKFSVLLVNGYTREEIEKRFPYLAKYLNRGEEMGYNERSSLKSRKRWWELPDLEPVKVLTIMSSNEKHRFFYNPDMVIEDARLYGISADKLIFQLLNFSFVQLQIQLAGRSNLGEGALDVKVYEIADLIIPKITKLKSTATNFEDSKVQKSLDREILLSLDYSPDEVETILKELYSAVEDLVNSRLDKAKSVKKTAQKRKKIDFDALLIEFKNELKTLKLDSSKESSQLFKELQEKVKNISPDSKHQKKILSLWWKDKFNKSLPTLAKLQKVEKDLKQGSLSFE